MLAEADYGATEQALGQDNSGDEQLYVKFMTQPKQNKAKSIEAGRPIFEDVEFIKIMQPGNKDNIVVRPVREKDKRRFPRHYAAFKNNEAEVVDGTPLEEWPGITRSMCEELKHFHIRTVEQLVGLSDTHAQNFMGIYELKQRAQAFLDAAEGNSVNEQFAAEIAVKDNQIEALEAQIKALQESVAKLQEAAEED